MYSKRRGVTATNSIFDDNTAERGGSFMLEDVTFFRGLFVSIVQNTALEGGAFYLKNSTLWGISGNMTFNSAAYGGIINFRHF